MGKMMKIDSDMLSVAAEFAVASELGRRNIYAQPTFSHQKRTDLLIFGKKGSLLRLEVKGKQSNEWPNCNGIADSKSILVLVDFAGKPDTERPDFYILTMEEWVDFVKEEIRKRPGQTIVLSPDNVPVWSNQVKNGKPYRGIGIKGNDVRNHKEKWNKIMEALE
jgi:hypothetical protein